MVEHQISDFEEDLKRCIEVMKGGGIILYPTDTVWGIGCDATNPDAVKKIYDLKKRADSKSMLVLVGDENMLYAWLKKVPETALQLIEVAVDPLTIIYDSPKGIAENLLAPDGSLGIRVTHDKFSASLCRRFRRPIVSTSANISGQPAAAIFSEISEEILNGVDHAVEFRRNDTGWRRPSGIIKVRDDETLTIIR